MGDLSKNFNRREFECSCGCGTDTVDAELIEVLEALRNRVDEPIKINSGHRCKNHNADIGGAEKSMHLTGKAADIVVGGIDACLIADYLNERYPDKYGIGEYETFTHIDVRKIKARW